MAITVSDAARILEERGNLKRSRKDQSEWVIGFVSRLIGRTIPKDLAEFYRERIERIGDFGTTIPVWNDHVGRVPSRPCYPQRPSRFSTTVAGVSSAWMFPEPPIILRSTSSTTKAGSNIRLTRPVPQLRLFSCSWPSTTSRLTRSGLRDGNSTSTPTWLGAPAPHRFGWRTSRVLAGRLLQSASMRFAQRPTPTYSPARIFLSYLISLKLVQNQIVKIRNA